MNAELQPFMLEGTPSGRDSYPLLRGGRWLPTVVDRADSWISHTAVFEAEEVPCPYLECVVGLTRAWASNEDLQKLMPIGRTYKNRCLK